MRKFLTPSIVPALLASIALPAAAQTRQTETAWLNATVSGGIADRLVYFAELQPRTFDGASRTAQVILRPAIGWAASKTVTLFQGYAHVVEPLDGGPGRHEDRLFQQVTWNIGTVGKLEVQSRTRLEQRWRSDGDGMSLRARQMMRFEYPLAPGEKRVAALASIEGFAGLKSADWGGRTGFDQVRGFIGLEIPLMGTSTIEAGYLNHTRDAPGRRIDMAHVASVALFVRL